jgi:hypothetical protein
VSDFTAVRRDSFVFETIGDSTWRQDILEWEVDLGKTPTRMDLAKALHALRMKRGFVLDEPAAFRFEVTYEVDCVLRAERYHAASQLCTPPSVGGIFIVGQRRATNRLYYREEGSRHIAEPTDGRIHFRWLRP